MYNIYSFAYLLKKKLFIFLLLFLKNIFVLVFLYMLLNMTKKILQNHILHIIIRIFIS